MGITVIDNRMQSPVSHIDLGKARSESYGATSSGKHSRPWAWVIHCGRGDVGGWGTQGGVGIAGRQGLPVMAWRRAVMALMPCLRAVSM